MVTLRATSHDLEDGRPRKIPRGPHDGAPGMPPMPINRGPNRGGPMMGVPLPPPPMGGPLSRTTATSRRGGRTRARSPIVSGRHPLSSEPGGRPPPGPGDRRGFHHPSAIEENPSSAAAAAAAAAKAYSDGSGGGHPGSGGRVSQWPPSERHPHDDRGYHHGMYGDKATYRGSHSKNWPSHNDDPKGHYTHHTYTPYGRAYDGYSNEGYPHGDRRYRGDRGGPTHHHHRGPPPDGQRGLPDDGRGYMYHHHHHHHPDYHHRTYMGPSRGEARGPPTPQAPPAASATEAAQSPKPSRTLASTGGHAGGGTSLVIGGTTPIHVPKSAERHPEPAERPTRASAASVFRGRGGSETTPPPTAAANGNQSNDRGRDIEQKAPIMSFKTPTSSFEDKKAEDSKQHPLSPKDPPPLHSTTQMFERSPEAPRNAPSIDIASSFPLFNPSFDSLAEGYLESTLESFGMARTGSGADADNPIRNAFSSGNASAQFLAPSASGQFTIGYSPVNSFGNGLEIHPQRSGSGNMMILGGPENRAASPSQVLSSYSQGYGAGGNGNHAGALEEGQMPLSSASFGGQSHGRPMHYAEGGYYMANHGPEKAGDLTPPFYTFLRRYKSAFAGCAFLLPGLKAALLENSPRDKSQPDSTGGKPPPAYGGDPTPQDELIARRRVESSVCAFGGNHGGVTPAVPQEDKGGKTNNTDSSIFRGCNKSSSEEQKLATVTPSSSVASPPRASCVSKIKAKYEEELPGRYYENESRLSWEFEENPPVEASLISSADDGSRLGQGEKKEPSKSSDDASAKRLGSSSPPASKMRYRCKLCGQPKQNHICPYQQSLARSIGIMIYPAVNAFTAAEPGTIAPPLSEMNNFTDIQSEKGSMANESSPGRSSVGPLTHPKQVTPDSARASPRQMLNSPPTTPGKTPTRGNGVVRRGGGRKGGQNYDGRGSDDQGDLLFLEPMELKPQQFVSVSYDLKSADSYQYAALPLPYAQRKRLSDNLFSLSNEVPKLTDECAQVLREAREKDKWDLAVAELMTQVVVVLHCQDGDHRFEGLRQYLLTLGIAC